jgi:hypothetical protein
MAERVDEPLQLKAAAGGLIVVTETRSPSSSATRPRSLSRSSSFSRRAPALRVRREAGARYRRGARDDVAE